MRWKEEKEQKRTQPNCDAKRRKQKQIKPKARQTHRLRPVYVYPIPEIRSQVCQCSPSRTPCFVVIYHRKGKKKEEETVVWGGSQERGVTAAGGTELCLGVMSLLSWDSSKTSCALSSSSSMRSPAAASPASLSAAAATAAAALLLMTASSASLSALRARTISFAVEAAVRDSI